MPPPGPRRPASRYGAGGFPYYPQPVRPLATGLYSTGTGTYNPYARPGGGLTGATGASLYNPNWIPPAGTRPTGGGTPPGVYPQGMGAVSQGQKTRAVASALGSAWKGNLEKFQSWLEDLIGFRQTYDLWEEGGRVGKPPSSKDWRNWAAQVGVQQQGSSWQQGLVTQRY